MVPLVKASLQTPPRMQGSWSDDDAEMSKAMVDSFGGVDIKLGPSIKGSPQILPQTRPLTSMTFQNHEKVLENYKSVTCKTLK